ncbi:hypothetical protein NIES30_09780 [Phormidium tenue NIES-30]|uniref:Serine/threonine protein kinase n=2 Tax=Phormidium tenue TaxID=126344 RepID=A0A1U7J612_9CYAN|nr:NERD domain-containing protein kinase family protein [Phormidium tenue]OKH48317.1 hypothetical protein NIES30_09780 [Phormidium tenue NIES-30]
MAARVFPIGEPVNSGEKRVIAALRDRLPKSYIVLHNLDIKEHSNARPKDFDAIVIGDFAVYAVEIKDWHGHITGNLSEWQLSRYYSRRNPVGEIQFKARVLHSYLSSRKRELSRIEVFGLVIIADDKTTLDIHQDNLFHVIKSKDIKNFFVSKNHLPKSLYKLNLIDDSLKQTVFSCIVDSSKPKSKAERNFREYSIIRELGSSKNDYYKDFLARHKLLQGRLAKLRVFDIDPYLPDKEKYKIQEKVCRESEVLINLEQHPNIARIYDVFLHNSNQICIVTEWLHGGYRLSEVLGNQEVDRSFSREILTQIFLAFSYVHGKGIIHRNISSDMILVSDKLVVKVMDFEFSRSPNLQTVATYALRRVRKEYISPEQYLEPALLSQKSDIYSLGVLAFKTLTGCYPYSSIRERIKDTEDELFLKRSESFNLSRNLIYILRSMIAFDPEDRPHSIDEFLKVFLNNL